MRIVFMGSPEYAAIILGRLAEVHEVVGVYTNADKVRSRGSKTDPTPVKALAEELGLPVFTPRTLRDEAVQEELRALTPDAICVAAYGKILPQAVLDIPPLGCINVHASLLPRWRGAAPIQRAILAGDEIQGVSIMRMEAGLDTGDYALQGEIDAQGKCASALTEELARLGAELLVQTLVQIEAGTVFWTVQDGTLATYASKIEKGELDITADDDCIAALRKVLASDAAHPAKIVLGGRSVALLDACPSDEALLCGVACLRGKRLLLGFGDSSLEVLSVKPDGKAAMPGKAFAAGIPNCKAGVSWSALIAEER